LCKAEYREGISWCRGCDAELAASLEPEADESVAPDWPIVTVWRGEDLETSRRIEAALQAAGIPCWGEPPPAVADLTVTVVERAEQVAQEVVSAITADSAERSWPDLVGAADEAMICPLCMGGFPAYSRFCSKCMVPVEPLESEERVAVVWEGDHPGDVKTIHDRLIRGTVPFHILDRQPQVSHVLVPRGPMQSMRYALRVLPEDEAAIHQILQQLPLSNVTLLETAPHPDLAEDPLEEPSGQSPQECQEEVWAGANRETAEALHYVFRENELPCCLEQDADQIRVMVAPVDLERARALVRQVVEGEVPEGLEET